MNLKIVNPKKFFRTVVTILAITIILLFIILNKAYSKAQVLYKEEYVAEGETLWSIVKAQYNTNSYFKNKDIREVIQEVKEVNNISNENLKIGQKILIPTI